MEDLLKTGATVVAVLSILIAAWLTAEMFVWFDERIDQIELRLAPKVEQTLENLDERRNDDPQ